MGRGKGMFVFGCVLLMLSCTACGTQKTEKQIKKVEATVSPEQVAYEKALEMQKNKQYEMAAQAFEKLGTYKDSSTQYYRSMFAYAKALSDMGEYDAAIENYKKLAGYENSKKLMEECQLKKAKEYYKNKKYKQALKVVKRISGNKKAKKLAVACKKQIQRQSNYFSLGYVVNDSEEYENNKYYEKGKGTLVLHSDGPIDDWVGLGGDFVTMTMPHSTICFKAINKGTKVIRNPKVEIQFNGLIMRGSEEGDSQWHLEYTNHVTGIGGYAGVIWKPDENLGPGSSKKFELNLNNAWVCDGKGTKMQISIWGDNYKKKSYIVQVKLKRV